MIYVQLPLKFSQCTQSLKKAVKQERLILCLHGEIRSVDVLFERLVVISRGTTGSYYIL